MSGLEKKGGGKVEGIGRVQASNGSKEVVDALRSTERDMCLEIFILA